MKRFAVAHMCHLSGDLILEIIDGSSRLDALFKHSAFKKDGTEYMATLQGATIKELKEIAEIGAWDFEVKEVKPRRVRKRRKPD